MTESLLTALILFVATLISSTFGFGSALFAMPLLTLFLGVTTATPLFGFVGPTIAGIILLRSWRQVDLASAWQLILATLAGIPFGVLLVKTVPAVWVTQALGLCLVAFGSYRLGQWRLLKLDSSRWALPFGFVAGILGGAYNTNGPPIVVYGEMRRWPPQQFRATLQSYFFPTGCGILVSHGVAGLWNGHILHLYGVALPGILGAIAIGGYINHHLPVHRFQRLLSALIILLGVMLWL
jgi:hypothetical protein